MAISFTRSDDLQGAEFLDVDLRGGRCLARAVDRLARAEQRLGGDAGPVRALATDEVAFDQRDAQPAVGDRLASPAFDDVAAGFDEIVYGRRPPGTQDIAAARTGWRRVLEEAARR